jgi:hypothetical protein
MVQFISQFRDPLGAFNKGRETRDFQEQRGLKLERAQAAQPGLISSDALAVDANKLAFERDSLIKGAEDISLLRDRGAQLNNLKLRNQEIITRGGNPEHTQEGIQLLEQGIQTGDFSLFDESIQDILSLKVDKTRTAEQRDRASLIKDIQPALNEDGTINPTKLNATSRSAGVALGLIPRSGQSAAERIAQTGSTSVVAESQAEIKGAETEAQERAKVDVKVGTAEKVGNAERKIKFLAETGTLEARDRNLLEKTSTSRIQNIKKAESYRDALKSGLRTSGVGRQAALFAPIGVWTDQGSFDEIFNSFAEIAARERLKASGELRPTDADVQGMKNAMFGVGRSEEANIVLLNDFIEEQRAMETKLSQPVGQSIEQAPTQPARKVAPAISPSGRSGGELQIDAQGNRAFVFPDGTFEEVQ